MDFVNRLNNCCLHSHSIGKRSEIRVVSSMLSRKRDSGGERSMGFPNGPGVQE